MSRPGVAAVLLAASALGLAGAWYVLATPILRRTAFVAPAISFVTWSDPVPVGRLPLTVARVTGAVGVVLAAWSWAMAWVGWRGRDAPGRGAGFAACLAAAIVSTVYLSGHLVRAAIQGWPMMALDDLDPKPLWLPLISDRVDGFAFRLLVDLGRIVAPAVLGALLIGAGSARRRPVGWVGWASLAVGLGWLAVGLVLAFAG